MKANQTLPIHYRAGREARQLGGTKYACPYNPISYQGGWWMGGWHDMDMEIEAQNSRAASAATDPDSLAA